jgi:hypothetical protein
MLQAITRPSPQHELGRFELGQVHLLQVTDDFERRLPDQDGETLWNEVRIWAKFPDHAVRNLKMSYVRENRIDDNRAVLPDGIFFKPKILIWVNFGGPCIGRCWNILRSFGLFYGHFMANRYILW